MFGHSKSARVTIKIRPIGTNDIYINWSWFPRLLRLCLELGVSFVPLNKLFHLPVFHWNNISWFTTGNVETCTHVLSEKFWRKYVTFSLGLYAPDGCRCTFLIAVLGRGVPIWFWMPSTVILSCPLSLTQLQMSFLRKNLQLSWKNYGDIGTSMPG